MESCIITLEFVQNIIEKRKREIPKGDCGRILIAAGSAGMAGAAILSCKGALRAGSRTGSSISHSTDRRSGSYVSEARLFKNRPEPL